MIFAPTMIRVLEGREQKIRLEVARLAREVAAGQEGLAALDETIAAVERRTRDNATARFAAGSRTVAELLELEQNSQSLRNGRAELQSLRQRSQQAIATLIERQRALTRQWRKEEVRLAHVTDLARRERVLADIKQFDAEDEAFTERCAASATASPATGG